MEALGVFWCSCDHCLRWRLFSSTRTDPIPITTERATIRDITELVSATGKIRPEVEVKISPEVAGEIIEMPVIVGQLVRKGDFS